jgi:uncharacterized CHY-type Zn-finger protein
MSTVIEKEHIICGLCGLKFDRSKENKHCSNCIVCTGCEVYYCYGCDDEIVITPIKPTYSGVDTGAGGSVAEKKSERMKVNKIKS